METEKIKPVVKFIVSNIVYIWYLFRERFFPVRGYRILIYHSLMDAANKDVQNSRLTQVNFRRHMQYLKQNGYRVISLMEMIDRLKKKASLPQKNIILTFDDGYKDFIEQALPILQEYGYSATIFVVAGLSCRGLQPKEGQWENLCFMSKDDILVALQAKMSIGSHSYLHKRLEDLNEKDLFLEISYSKEVLENEIKEGVNFFSYPFGSLDKRSEKILKESGYLCACGSRIGINRNGDGFFRLKRTDILTKDKDMFEFKKKLLGCYDWIGYFDRLLKK